MKPPEKKLNFAIDYKIKYNPFYKTESYFWNKGKLSKEMSDEIHHSHCIARILLSKKLSKFSKSSS
jgi:hypothetical protein